jgi:geranylgeranyl diphosphate synthase type I
MPSTTPVWASSEVREIISDELQRRLKRWAESEQHFPEMVADVQARLSEFSQGGKMLRGCLTYWLATQLQPNAGKDAVIAAAAVEIFGSGLLIHDDILDQDTVRRGKPSIYAQYQSAAPSQPERYGVGQGICVGDICLFLAQQWLAELSDPQSAQSCNRILASEALTTGIAEMTDFAWGLTPEKRATAQDVAELYLAKTARYTVSLPLQLGAVIGGGSPALVKDIANWGSVVGQLFQLQDDELGLLGDSDKTGKPVGADVREGKWTLWRVMLEEVATPGERTRLQNCFGNSQLSTTELTWLQDLARTEQVQQRITIIRDTWTATATTQLTSLQLPPAAYAGLAQLLEFVTHRRR